MTVRIALVGDQTDHPSHRELNAVRRLLGVDVEPVWVPTDSREARDLSGFHGIWVVPGSPYADDVAVLSAIRWAREADRPLLGTCGGLQYGVVEFARNVLGDGAASHEESDGAGEDNVVVALACSLQGESRTVEPVRGTRFAELVDNRPFEGMHFCGYGPTDAVVERLVGAGMVVGATAQDAGAEVLELPSSRFHVLSLFQPHVGTIAGQPLHPLIGEFVRCAREVPR